MYYSLQNYYDTRVDTIEVSEKLSKIDVDKLQKRVKISLTKIKTSINNIMS